MTYSTLMVHLDLGVSNAALLQVSADLAQRHRARVIGIAAFQPMQLSYGDGGYYGGVGYLSPELAEQDRSRVQTQIDAAEAQFRAALGQVADLQWRSSFSFRPLADYLAEQASAADLLITSAHPSGALTDSSRRANISDVLMHIGRPVLIVAPDAGMPNLHRVVVGWKDSRETRRAISDALPLLKTAEKVTVVEITSDDGLAAASQRLEDVVAWLRGHAVATEPLAVPAEGDTATQLDAIAQHKGAGLLVAGAYGHSRFREWMLGGVTRNLLHAPGRCVLLSH